MRKTIIKIVSHLLVISVLTTLLVACPDELLVSKQEDKAIVSFSVTDGAARTVLPQVSLTDVASYSLLGGLNGAAETILIESFTGMGASISLEPGTWNFTLNAYNRNGEHILQGKNQNKPITLTGPNEVSFSLLPMNDGTGTILITLNFPESANITLIVVKREIDGKIDSEDFTVNSGNFVYSKNEIASGDYLIHFELYREDLLRTVVSEQVLVRDNLASSKTITLAGVDLKPLLTGTVNIIGTAIVGELLTVDTYSLNGIGDISYQWKRNETAEIGLDSSTYTVQDTDIDGTITVTVSRSNYIGSVTSNPTPVVVDIPALTGTVSIMGTAQLHQTLTADTSLLDISGITFFQWKRNGTIDIGTNNTYTVQTADVGSTITVTVTCSHARESVTSEPTAAVILPTPVPLTGNLAQKLAWLETNAQGNTSYILEVSANESIAPHTLYYGNRRGISITLSGVGANRTVSLSSNGSMFTVGDTTRLILDNNVTLQGRNSNSNSLVYVNGGTFIMDGGTVSGNTFASSSTATPPYGGGVYVSDNGTFIMNGGEVSGNTASSSASTNHSRGGGVYVAGNGTFTMNDGVISGNTVSASITSTNAFGGGVYAEKAFTMNGGVISGNTASPAYSNYAAYGSSGGGVYAATFTMNGGEISGNTAAPNGSAYFIGGGVYVTSATYIVTGTIYGLNEDDTSLRNAASSGVSLYRGGGTVHQYGTFDGGTWSSNGDLATSPNTIKVVNGVLISDGANINVTLNSVTHNGTSTQPPTELTLTFDQAINGLGTDDIFLSGISIQKGILSGSGPVYTLPILGITSGGDLTVRVAKPGYAIVGSPKTLMVSMPVTLNSVSANGSSTQTTTQLTLTFSQAIPSLGINDITLSGISGIQKGTFSGTGPSYTLTVNGFTSSGNLTVTVAKTGYEIAGSPATVPIYYLTPVTFSSVAANGSATQTTTQLTLTFTQAIPGLSANDITLSDVPGVQKGSLSGSGPVYTLPISGFTESGTLAVRVSKEGYSISYSLRGVTIYHCVPVTLISVTANGSSTTQSTSDLILNFSQAIPRLSAYDITLSGVFGVNKGVLSGTGPSYTLPIGVSVGGTLTVSVTKEGYDISGSPVTVSIVKRSPTVKVFEVWNTNLWNAALDAIAGGGNNEDYTISVTNEFSVGGRTTASFGAASNITVSLKGNSEMGYNNTISLSSNGHLLNIGSYQHITMEDVILKGMGTNTNSLVYVYFNGSFTMDSGKIIGNTNGGGVGVLGGWDSGININGIFTMNDGEISGNSSGVSTNGTFTLNKGKITGNINGSGVSMESGFFIMNGGEISNNTNKSSGRGGGVYLFDGIFMMNDGEISGNTVTNDWRGCLGGGVYVGSFGTFYMGGGTISGNTAKDYGGGVYLEGYRTAFYMASGTICGSTEYTPALRNTASAGSALYIGSSGGSSGSAYSALAHYGTFSGTTWSEAETTWSYKGSLNTEEYTIWVVNGVRWY